MVLPALIAAGASIAGGIFASKKSEKASNAANATQMQVADRNIELQKQFAREGIQWKVEDAKKAGIHPLAALGAQTHSFSPVAVGSSIPDYSPLAQAGQDVSRAIHATRSPGAKLDAFTQTAQALSVERMGLENELLRSQIAKVTQPATPPGIPVADGTNYLIDGQTDTIVGTPSIEFNEKFERSPSRPGAPYAEYGTIPEITWMRTPDGGYAIAKSKDAQERLEDDWMGSMAWNLRNRVAPALMSQKHMPPPDIPLHPNQYWYYSPITGVYYIRSRGGIRDGIPPPPVRRPR